jgi:hypothetical protein
MRDSLANLVDDVIACFFIAFFGAATLALLLACGFMVALMIGKIT